MSKVGIVYSITCNLTGESYIGSTESEYKRIAGHKTKTQKCSSKPIIDRGYYTYKRLEIVDYENAKELRQHEQKFIETYRTEGKKVVNKVRAFRTPEQKRECDNAKAQRWRDRDGNKEKMKKWREDNKDKINAYAKKYYAEKVARKNIKNDTNHRTEEENSALQSSEDRVHEGCCETK